MGGDTIRKTNLVDRCVKIGGRSGLSKGTLYNHIRVIRDTYRRKFREYWGVTLRKM